ncbi:MAG: hypothetical protein M1832_004729 [Thelocarpon impressellum]|nr:MAG: hypothetical protein M1832_004729 [Thelocarpon impressellum]
MRPCLALSRLQSRKSSTRTSSLTARRLPLVLDHLSPTPSHLLTHTLSPFLSHPLLPAILSPVDSARPLPQGHHLAYFPPCVPTTALLPDGTDALHSPGAPYTRRLWAGGRVAFNIDAPLHVDGSRAACVERIVDVHRPSNGAGAKDKVFVTIERRVGDCPDPAEPDASIRARLLGTPDADLPILEHRRLVFLPPKTSLLDPTSTPRIVPAPRAPTRTLSLIPTRALLFRFSALTFNAHLLHLDTLYTQSVEGLRDLVVHGPLTLALLLAFLAPPGSGRVVREVEYRNLAPLFVGEELTLSVREREGGSQREEVEAWIAGPEGGVAVRGSASLERR